MVWIPRFLRIFLESNIMRHGEYWPELNMSISDGQGEVIPLPRLQLTHIQQYPVIIQRPKLELNNHFRVSLDLSKLDVRSSGERRHDKRGLCKTENMMVVNGESL